MKRTLRPRPLNPPVYTTKKQKLLPPKGRLASDFLAWQEKVYYTPRSLLTKFQSYPEFKEIPLTQVWPNLRARIDYRMLMVLYEARDILGEDVVFNIVYCWRWIRLDGNDKLVDYVIPDKSKPYLAPSILTDLPPPEGSEQPPLGYDSYGNVMLPGEKEAILFEAWKNTTAGKRYLWQKEYNEAYQKEKNKLLITFHKPLPIDVIIQAHLTDEQITRYEYAPKNFCFSFGGGAFELIIVQVDGYEYEDVRIPSHHRLLDIFNVFLFSDSSIRLVGR